MTNYIDRDNCYWCGVSTTGGAGQVEIANSDHVETEVEEIGDVGNQGDTVTAPDSRGGPQHVVVDETVDAADKYGRIDGQVGGEANYISGVDVYFSWLTSIFQSTSFFERPRKGNKFLS